MAFDINGARSAGYNDDEIADFLAQERGFDIGAARASGYSGAEVIGFLGAEAPKPPLIERAKAFLRGSATPPAETPTPGLIGADPMGTGAAEILEQPNADPRPLLERPATPEMLAMQPKGFSPQEMAEGSVAPWRAKQIADAAAYGNTNRSPVLKPVTGSPTGDALRTFDRKPLDNSLFGAITETAGDAGRGLSTVLPSLAKSGYGVLQAGAEVTGADSVSSFARAAQDAGADWLVQFDNPNGDKLVTGAFQSLGTAVAGGAVGGTAGAIGLAVGQTAADKYNELRKGGIGLTDSLEGATVHGVAEYLGERIGMKSLARMVDGIASKTGMPPLEALKEALKQQGEEQVTLAIQSVYDKLGSGSLRGDITIDDYLNDVVTTAQQTAIMTAAAAGGGRIARAATQGAQMLLKPGLAAPQAAPEAPAFAPMTDAANIATAPAAEQAPINLMERQRPPVTSIRVEDQPTTPMTPEEILAAPMPAPAPRIDTNSADAEHAQLGLGQPTATAAPEAANFAPITPAIAEEPSVAPPAVAAPEQQATDTSSEAANEPQYKTRTAATVNARRTGGTVAEVPGGFTVAPKPTTDAARVNARPADARGAVAADMQPNAEAPAVNTDSGSAAPGPVASAPVQPEPVAPIVAESQAVAPLSQAEIATTNQVASQPNADDTQPPSGTRTEAQAPADQAPAAARSDAASAARVPAAGSAAATEAAGVEATPLVNAPATATKAVATEQPNALEQSSPAPAAEVAPAQVESVQPPQIQPSEQADKPATTALPAKPPKADAEPPYDAARAQELRNSITEGEGILKSGRNAIGVKQSAVQLAAVRRSVKSAQAKLEALGEDPRNGTALSRRPSDDAGGESALSRTDSADRRNPARRAEDITQLVEQITARWANAPEVVVVEDLSDPRVPESVRAEDSRQQSQGATGSPEGMYYKGKVYLVASELRGNADVVRVLFHEALGHAGLRGTFGNDLTRILDRLSLVNEAKVRAKALQYGLDFSKPGDRRAAAEEVLAELAQKRPENSLVQSAIAAIRAFLRDHIPGFSRMRMTDAEIVRNFILPARRFVERGGATVASEGPTFSRSKNDRGIISVKQIGPKWAVTRNQGTGNEQHLGYHDSQAAAERAADIERNRVSRDNGRKGGRWWIADNAPAEDSTVPIGPATRGPQLDAVGRARAVEETLAARSSAIQSTVEGLGLKQVPENAGDCFGLATEASQAGLGDMVLGLYHGDEGSIWHAVIMRDGAVYDPTFQRWFEPGVYEALGFEPRMTLSPEEVRRRANGSSLTPLRLGLAEDDATLFSRADDAPQLPASSKFDDFTYKFANKQVDLKRVIETVRRDQANVADDVDAYLQEELFHGRAAKRTEDFVNDELRPLTLAMKARSLSMDEVNEYLHARHAEEANALIAERTKNEDKPLLDGGSGMTNQEARDYMAALTPEKKKGLEAVAKQVDAIIAKTRNIYAWYSLESRETVDGWAKTFKHYVPLMREDKNSTGMGIGQGFSIKGRESKSRTGSTAKVVDILANIALQREKAIVRGEKNRVAVALAGLVDANPMPGFWSLDKVPTQRVVDEKTNEVVTRPDPMYKNRDNALVAKYLDSKGQLQERVITFNEGNERAMRMAAALKNLDAARLEGLLGITAKFTRYFAAINTQWNLIFGLVNLVRDVQGAVINISTTPIKDKRLRVLADTFPALLSLYGATRNQRKGEPLESKWWRLWDDFQAEGGQTGYRDLFANSADRAAAIQKMLDPDSWTEGPLGKVFTAGGALKMPMSAAYRGAGAFFDWLSDTNLALENAVRISAYSAGLDAGLSKQRAASLAKNLTTNFNRKGQVAQQAGALYAFFNASMQGTARMAEVLFDMKDGDTSTLRLSKVGTRIIAGGLLLGVMQALTLAAAGFDDEDPPDFVRERNLILPIGGKKYLTLPMPLGWHVIPNIGRMVTEFALDGFKGPTKRVFELMSLIADAFNPIGNSGISLQTIAPTVLDPLVALAENRDWTGRPIAKESYDKSTPGMQLARDTASSPAKWISEAINYMTGGTEFTAGALSPTPDQIDYLWGQVAGGVGREMSKADQTIMATWRGEALPPHKIPLIGRFYGDADGDSGQVNRFYSTVDRVNAIDAEIKGLSKAGRNAEALAFYREHPEAKLINDAKNMTKEVRELRAHKRELLKRDAPREQVKAIEDQMAKRMRSFNDYAARLRAKSEQP